MWVPTSEAAIRERAQAGDLTETATFEGKRELPVAAKSKDLAIDVAALANEGGVILYGLGEDEAKHLTILAPFALAGVAERIDSIVRTAISEPPVIEVKPIPSEADPAVGYIAVVVPPSPRAPHMVIKDKDYRYYGRSVTGNVRLTEGEVARLYTRRQQWEIDREALLDTEIARSPIHPHSNFGFLYVVARPIVANGSLLDQVKDRLAPQARDVRPALDQLLAEACAPQIFSRSVYVPDLERNAGWERVADGHRVFQGYNAGDHQPGDPNRVITFAFDEDGTGHLFCGRAAANNGEGLIIYEPLIVGLTMRFAHLVGNVCNTAGYVGPVDLGVAITGVEGGLSWYFVKRLHEGAYFRDRPVAYDRATYRRTLRVSASDLYREPQKIAQSLTERLYRATSNGWYDPFSAN